MSAQSHGAPAKKSDLPWIVSLTVSPLNCLFSTNSTFPVFQAGSALIFGPFVRFLSTYEGTLT